LLRSHARNENCRSYILCGSLMHGQYSGEKWHMACCLNICERSQTTDWHDRDAGTLGGNHGSGGGFSGSTQMGIAVCSMRRAARRNRVFYFGLTAGEWRGHEHCRHRDRDLRYRFVGARRNWQHDFLKYFGRRSDYEFDYLCRRSDRRGVVRFEFLRVALKNSRHIMCRAPRFFASEASRELLDTPIIRGAALSPRMIGFQNATPAVSLKLLGSFIGFTGAGAARRAHSRAVAARRPTRCSAARRIGSGAAAVGTARRINPGAAAVGAARCGNAWSGAATGGERHAQCTRGAAVKLPARLDILLALERPQCLLCPRADDSIDRSRIMPFSF